ncbi:hypothetical protein, partial [Ornithobacterium rhinotracheale]
MKRSILQCGALQKHLFLDKHKANAPKRNFGFSLFIQDCCWRVASYTLLYKETKAKVALGWIRWDERRGGTEG